MLHMTRNKSDGGSRSRSKLRIPTQKSFTLTSLEQVKVLADPLRMKILEALGQERTTKQVADLLGEKPTRLYHHVEALERVGVIELTRTQQNRGTLEKYYLAVAQSFRASPELFSQGEADQGNESLVQVVSTLMNETTEELRALAASGKAQSLEEEGILTHAKIIASAAEIAEVQKELQAVLERVMQIGDADEIQEDDREYRLTIAYFPLDIALDTQDSED